MYALEYFQGCLLHNLPSVVFVAHLLKFFILYSSILCPQKYHKTIKHSITVWRFNNINDRYNRDESFPTSIAPHYPGDVHLPQDMTPKPFISQRDWDVKQVLLIISGYGSLGYWSRKTIHYFYHCRKNDDGISEEEGLEVSYGK